MATQIVSNYLNFDYNTRKYFNLNYEKHNNLKKKPNFYKKL